MRISLVFVVTLLSLLWSQRAFAFDYLEHTWFSDRACLEAQHRLAPWVAEPQSEEAAARYLALSLFCPLRWDRPYCQDDYKMLEGAVTVLEEEPARSGDHSLTLGDLAALADHFSQWGPAQGFAQVKRPGLTGQIFGWLSREHSDADGILGDVAEDACETRGLVPWDRVEADVRVVLAEDSASPLQSVPSDFLLQSARSPLPEGPGDPAGAYSFDNPHYLDLVLRNHHHFGSQAYASWLGFHSAARGLAKGRCEDVLAFDAGTLEDLSEELPELATVDWGEVDEEALRRLGCGALARLLQRRVALWFDRAQPELVAPAQGWRPLVGKPGEPLSPEQAAFLDRVVSAFFGVIFEGAGLHFLQDVISGGHVRTDRTARGLEHARYDHDEDNRIGVPVSLGTRAGLARLVAFGDRYLLGPAPAVQGPCDWAQMEGAPPSAVSACLLRHQRGTLVAMSAASLMDWVLGGLFQDEPEGLAGPEACNFYTPEERFICHHLPTRAPTLDGLQPPGPAPLRLAQGEMPLPPPPFSYQSLVITTGLDLGGEETRSGVRFSLLSELGSLATWMTSYQMGALVSGEGPEQRWAAEFGYSFHWRWAARFLMNMGPYAYSGLRGFGEDVSVYAGVGPALGFSALPEGWIKIPLEVTVTWRLPFTLVDSRPKHGPDIEAWWLELGLGLAFQ